MTSDVTSLTATELRKKHPRFIYRSFHWKHENDTLMIGFEFFLQPEITFRPTVKIGPISAEKVSALSPGQIDLWVFHLGLIELFSYWKATASPEIVLEAGALSPEQIAWWKEVLLGSMGEYFYTNDLDFTQPDFVRLVNAPQAPEWKTPSSPALDSAHSSQLSSQEKRVLLPIGGGKDSALLLEMLEQAHRPYDILLSYPQSPAAEIIAHTSKAGQIFRIYRHFDSQLFELNKQGYLNGHTPFSARLAIESSFLALLAGHSQVLLANESSANEGNVPFHGTVVNHQYSKTFEFEEKFRKYVEEYLSPAPEYLSALRPLTELQIAGLFARLPRFHSTFKSCNKGQQKNVWCCECPKCLFVFAVLSPFLEETELVGPIFPEDLFQKLDMVEVAQALMGNDADKPFECVGTLEETQSAFFLSIEKFHKTHPGENLPVVLQAVWDRFLQHAPQLQQQAEKLLCFWNSQNNLDPSLTEMVQSHSRILCHTPRSTQQSGHHTALKKLEKPRIVILGMGREGWSTYQFLRKKFPGKNLTLADQRLPETLPVEQQEILKKDVFVSAFWGDRYTQALQNAEIIFKTPGIPQTIPAVAQALERGAKLHSHAQLFFELCEGTIIGITGTKGKSTTSAVIHHVLKENGLDTVFVGNIGQPALELLPKISADTLVVFELSSHQLETMTLSPHISVVQDVTSEHLDYYADTMAYRQAKTAIARFQKSSDFMIFNPQFSGALEIARLSNGQHLHCTLTEGPDAVVFVRNGVIHHRDTHERIEPILPTQEIPLHGEHNILNVMPSIVVGKLLNLSADQIATAIRSFKALPHRLEFVLERKGIRYYDDSLSTMPEAAVGALRSFSPKKGDLKSGENPALVLIAGGYERYQDFTPLAEEIYAQNVVGLVLFQPTGERLADAVKKQYEKLGENNLPVIEFVENMREAVHVAQNILTEKNEQSGVVIMSPASASFGMFRDYHDRGEQFKEAVKRLVGE